MHSEIPPSKELERTRDAQRRAAETLKRRLEERVPADDDSADE